MDLAELLQIGRKIEYGTLQTRISKSPNSIIYLLDTKLVAKFYLRTPQQNTGHTTATPEDETEFYLQGISVRPDHISFENESESLEKIKHPNIITTIGKGATITSPQLPYIILEYIKGQNLAEHSGNLNPKICRKIIHSLCHALNAVHEKNIVHYDVKPTNMIITEDKATLIDFGLSRKVNTRPRHDTVEGTPLYLSPEHARSRPADPRSDIYSLGVTIYHALKGEPPFKGTAINIIVQHIRDPIPKLEGFPRDLCEIIRKCTEKDPNKRYQTPLALLSDLS